MVRINKLEKIGFLLGIELGVISYLVLFLGFLRLLSSTYVVVIMLIAVYVLVYFANINKNGSLHNRVNLDTNTTFEIILFIILAILSIFPLFKVLAPAVGNDALAYHLFHPKIFIKSNYIGFIPYTRESLWPYLGEMLFTAGMIMKNEIFAKFFHYLFGVMTVVLIYTFGKRFFNRKTGLIASALFLSSPGIFMQMPYAYVDLILCFYIFASFYAFLLWNLHKNAKWIIISGIFMGFAFSTKILAVLGLISLIALFIYKLLIQKKERKVVFNHFLIFLLTCFIFSFIWYLRSWFVLGNPVFPFASNIFGAGWQANIGKEMGYIRNLWGFLRLPWDLVMHYKSFGGEQIGVAFLLFLPGILFINWKKETNIMAAIFALTYTILWFILDPNIRFLFPVFPLIFYLLAQGIYKFIYQKQFKFVKYFFVLSLFLSVLLEFYYNIDAVKYVFGRINKEEYLLKKERTYKLAEWVNKNTPKNSVIISEDPRLFYFNRKIIYLPRIYQFKSNINQIATAYSKVYLIIKKDLNKERNYMYRKDNFIKKNIPVYETDFSDNQQNIKYTIYKNQKE